MTRATRNHFKVAWGLFKPHWAVFVLAELTIVAAWLALEVAVVAVHRSPIPIIVDRVAWLTLHLGFLWFFCAVMAGIHFMALQAVDGDVPAFRTAFRRLDRGQSYLLASLLYWAAVFVGLCLAIIPGIVIAVRWALFRLVLANESSTALTSLHDAASLSAFQRWPLFRILALSVAVNLAGTALLGVGLLVTFPVTLILRAIHFRALRQQAGGHTVMPNNSFQPKPLRGSA